MNSQTQPQSTYDDDEIDLKELFFALWAGKIWIAICTVFFAFGAVVYALSLDPRYESKSVFELKSSSRSSGLASQFGGLAALAGVSVGSNGDGAILDRLAGRDFVVRLAGDVGLAEDPFFAPSASDGGFSVRAFIKGLFLGGGDESASGLNDPIDQIHEAYIKNVSVQPTKNGSYEVIVTHEDPDRAAVIANAIVDRLVSETSGEARAEDLAQLNYLSEQLAEAATQMEDTSQAVSEFALANSLSAPGAFAQRSEEIYQLNEQQRRSIAMISAVNAIQRVLEANPSPSFPDYLALKSEHTIVDEVEFRRLLSISESLTQWVWPDPNRLTASLDVLTERVARSESRLAELNREAERYATSSEQLMILKRDAAVASATYQVLIEQVKAQSLASGFEGETVRIYQLATPPIKASAPKKTLIAALGIVLGGFFGSAIALVLAMRSGKLFTKSTISKAIDAKFDVAIPRLLKVRSLRKPKFEAVISNLSNDVGFVDLMIEANKQSTGPVLIASLARGVLGLPLGLAVAENLAEAKSVGVIMLSDGLPAGIGAGKSNSSDIWDIFEWTEKIDLLRLKAKSGNDLARALSEQIEVSSYDRIVIAVSGELSASVARALAECGVYTAVISQPGKTTRHDVDRMRQTATINVNVSLSK